VGEERPIDLVCHVHCLVAEGSGRILNESDVVTKLHPKASGGLDAGISYHANEDDFLDPAYKGWKHINPSQALANQAQEWILPPTWGVNANGIVGYGRFLKKK
jgi:hypothetical protein